MTRRSGRAKFLIAALVAALCFLSPILHSQEPAVAVLYPDLNDYNAVFESISDGVEKKTPGKIYRLPLSQNYSPTELKQELAAHQVRSVIALGRRGLEAIQKTDWTGPIAVSAVIWDPSLRDRRIPGIVLDPDPRKIFSTLRTLAPQIRRVHTVITPDQNSWLAERSRNAAAEFGIALVIKEATTKRSAAIAYLDVLNSIDRQHDALWLPLDPAFDEATLQLVLSTAWKNRVVVFSSAPEHAQRGALFSFYPDYNAIGQRLAGVLAEPRAADSTSASLRPAIDLKLAVNLRTARHLGLEYSRDVETKFEVVFK